MNETPVYWVNAITGRKEYFLTPGDETRNTVCARCAEHLRNGDEVMCSCRSAPPVRPGA